MCACPQRRGGSQYARERTGAAAASAGDAGPVLSCSTTGTCVAYTELRRAVQSTLGAVTPLWLEGSRDSLCWYYASMRACVCCVSTDTSAVACMGRTASKAALRMFGPPLALRVTRAHRAYDATCMDARGDGAGATYRIRMQLQFSQCSRGPRALQRVPFLLMLCTEPCKHLLRKASRLNSTAQLTRQPRSGAVSSTTASLRVTLALVAALLDRRRARDEHAHIHAGTSLLRGLPAPHLHRY